jgi:uncharacterized protein with PQ loop repeat
MTTILPPHCLTTTPTSGPAPATRLEKILRVLSVATIVMTVPQAVSIWVNQDAGGVSVAPWAAYLVSACLWFVYGVEKRDKTIYLACIGWIAVDAAIVAGVIVYR